MGASESTFSTTQRPNDELTTVSERTEAVDPILQRRKSMEIATWILTSTPAESSLAGTINPNVLLEVFSVYRDWQERKATDISIRQEDIENKIEVANALAVKLLQLYKVSVSAMKTSSLNLSEVDALQVELGELKGWLTEVISNCHALCKRIRTEGPESLRSSIKPFTSLVTTESLPSALDKSQSSTSLTTDLATPNTLPSSETNIMKKIHSDSLCLSTFFGIESSYCTDHICLIELLVLTRLFRFLVHHELYFLLLTTTSSLLLSNY